MQEGNLAELQAEVLRDEPAVRKQMSEVVRVLEVLRARGGSEENKRLVAAQQAEMDRLQVKLDSLGPRMQEIRQQQLGRDVGWGQKDTPAPSAAERSLSCPPTNVMAGWTMPTTSHAPESSTPGQKSSKAPPPWPPIPPDLFQVKAGRAAGTCASEVLQ